MSAIDILRAAHALIADPVRFTSGGLAMNEAGWLTTPTSRTAVRWSAFGAIRAVNQGLTNEQAEQALRDALAEVFPNKTLAGLVDHKVSLHLLDRAILKVASSPSAQSRSVLARAEERRRANPPPFEGHAVWEKLSPEFQAEIGALALDYAAAFNALDGTSLSEARRRVAEDDLFGTILEAVPVEEWRGDDGRVRVPSSFGVRI